MRLASILGSSGLKNSSLEVHALIKYADAPSLARALRDAQVIENKRSESINYQVPGSVTEWTEDLEISFRNWMTSMRDQGLLPKDRSIASYYSDQNGDGKHTLKQKELNSLLNQPANQSRTTTVQRMTQRLEAQEELRGLDRAQTIIREEEQRQADSVARREQATRAVNQPLTNKQKYDQWRARLRSGEFDASTLIGNDPTGQKAQQAAEFACRNGHDELCGQLGSMEDTSFSQEVLNAPA